MAFLTGFRGIPQGRPIARWNLKLISFQYASGI
jgi:hypothetical protein